MKQQGWSKASFKKIFRVFCILLLFGSVSQTALAENLTWSGQLWATNRLYVDTESVEDSYWRPKPRVDLDIEVVGEQAELRVRLRFDPAWSAWNPNTPFHQIVNEAYLRGFIGSLQVEAGYMKVVWGKGDNVHVLDVLNPTTYYDFVNNDYLDRRISEWMVRFLYPLGDLHGLELVWVPVTTPDTIPFTGRWKPHAISLLEGQLSISLQDLIEGERVIQEELSSLTEGTYGIRLTGSSGGIDYGVLYAYTYHRQPKVDLRKFLLAPATGNIYLRYDRIHVFGIEGAAAWEGFNFRMEGGYFLTDDLEGKDPLVRNNWVGYVLGFDRDLWTDGVNLNIQLQGIVPLHADTIDRNPRDIEYRPDDRYTSHTLAGTLMDTVWENRFTVKLSAALGVEHQDLRLAPEIGYEPFDDFEITLRWVQYIGDRDTSFGQFRDNSFLEVGLSYRF